MKNIIEYDARSNKDSNNIGIVISKAYSDDTNLKDLLPHLQFKKDCFLICSFREDDNRITLIRVINTSENKEIINVIKSLPPTITNLISKYYTYDSNGKIIIINLSLAIWIQSYFDLEGIMIQHCLFEFNRSCVEENNALIMIKFEI
jgi:hypothetical protein